MSHYMTALAMRQTGLKPAAKIVLYWLADHHNSETCLCFPSLSTLAGECEMDVATVKRHLSALEAAGLIERQRRHRENGSQTSTQYILRLDTPLAQNAPPPSAKCATPLAQKQPPLNLGNNNLGNKPIDQPSPDHGFSDFWDVVPHKIGKEPARKAWTKLSAQERQLAHERVGAFYEWFKRTYKDASPLHPSTYLNNKRWTDVEPQKRVDPEHAKRVIAINAIKNGHSFMASSITLSLARELIEAGQVTADECQKIGLRVK